MEWNYNCKKKKKELARLLNFVENKIAAHDEKVELNTVECTTAFLNSKGFTIIAILFLGRSGGGGCMPI